jgi:uncharacterized protein (DUF1499 family)
MTSKLRERRSRLAVWSVRFALVSLPILVIAAVGHRSGRLSSIPTYGSMALGFALAALAVLCALIAFEAIWRDGRKGAGAAVRGFVLGLLVLSLAGMGAWKAVEYPQLTDISTDTDDPPDFVAALAPRAAEGVVERLPSRAEIAAQADAYPDIVPRHYPVDSIRVYDAAKAIVDKRRWIPLAAERPADEDQPGRIEATAWTLLFGFRQDVVIRISPDGDGALVDMRSASRDGTHDLGANAARIRAFFADLDTALQGIAGEDVEN